MSLPPGLQTVTLTARRFHPDGSPMIGAIVLTPEPATITSATYGVILAGPVTMVFDPYAIGEVTEKLLATDAAGCTPTGWTYMVTEIWDGVQERAYPISLPAATPVVNLASIAPTNPASGTYLAITGPVGPAGPAGVPGSPGAAGATGATGPAGPQPPLGAVTDIAPLGTRAAGATGKAADAGHVHPTTNLVVTVPAPTGVAATDQANINAAIAALPGTGGTVQLQAGTYVVPAPGSASAGCVNMSVNNSALVGAGMGVTTIQLAPGTTGVTGIVRTPSAVANSRITFRDFTIDGNAANQTGTPLVVGFYCGVTPNSTATDTDISVIRVEVMNCVGYGFDPHERTTRLYMLGCISHNNGTDGTHDGFTLDGCYDSTAIGCISYSNGRHGFNLVTASKNVTLTGCDSYGNGGGGYVLQNGAKFNSLVGCKAHDNTLEGILINGVPQTGQQDNTPGGHNSIKSCTIGSSGTHGIHLVGTSYNHVSGNTVRDSSQTTTNTSNQIYLDESGTVYSTYNTIENNDLGVASGITNLPKYGIFEKTTNEDFNFVLGNRSLGAATAQTLLAGATSVRLAAHNGINEHPATAPYVQDTPAQHGLVEWSFAPSSASATSQVTAGKLYLSRITAQTGGAVSELVLNVTTAGAGLTPSYVALFDSAGNLLTVSADISAQLASAGAVALLLPSYSLAPGQTILAGVLVGNGSTTAPFFGRGASGTGARNWGLITVSPLMISNYGSALTAMPTTITLASTTASGAVDFWFGLY